MQDKTADSNQPCTFHGAGIGHDIGPALSMGQTAGRAGRPMGPRIELIGRVGPWDRLRVGR